MFECKYGSLEQMQSLEQNSKYYRKYMRFISRLYFFTCEMEYEL